MLRTSKWLPILVWASFAVACDLFVGDYQIAPEDDEEAVSAVDASELCELELEQFAFPVDLTSSSREPSLEVYYERANPDFVEHLEDVAASYRRGEFEARVTYLQGAAGVGKSFVTRNVLEAFAPEEQCTVLIGELFTALPNDAEFSVTIAPDLATLDGERVFNELPTAEEPTRFDVMELLRTGGCAEGDELPPLVVIDGVDEVLQETSHALLKSVDALLEERSNTKTFLHILLVGRPEGFGSWLSDPNRTERNNALLDSFQLNAPRYQTAGDLAFRVEGYLDFIGEAERLERDGELTEYVESTMRAVEEHPFLTYSLGNLSVGNVIVEHTAPGLNESEPLLKAGLFDDIVLRNSLSHGRPGAGEQLASAYRRALEDVAAQYADVNSDGTFGVRSEDTVEVFDDDGRRLGEVRVRNLLNRSGVAFLTMATTRTTRYRFDPFWLHAHLIERRNVRTVADYEYRACE